MIYITGEDDTLAGLRPKVDFPGPLLMYHKEFAKANGNFLQATPFYEFGEAGYLNGVVPGLSLMRKKPEDL